jgi:CRP/FNR family transcriptional regulator, cyclic AMP receptor protein
METLGASLADHPIFKGLESTVLGKIIEGAVEERYDGGQAIFREGESADRVYVVRSGKVALEVFRLDPGPVTIQVLESDEVLGWSWLVPPYRWRFDARALTPVRLFAIDGLKLRDECQHSPRLGQELLKRFVMVMDQRMQAMRVQLVECYCRTT